MTNFAFLDAKNQPTTKQIAQTDVRSTVAWLALQFPELDLLDNIVGSASACAISNNIDLIWDPRQKSAQEIFQQLATWAKSYNLKVPSWVQKRNNQVLFKCPITGRPSAGFVQVNFWPTQNRALALALMQQVRTSAYKARERNVLIRSIAYTQGLDFNPLAGLRCQQTKKIQARTADEVAKALFGLHANVDAIATVESMLALLAKDQNRQKKLALFLQHLNIQGIPFNDQFWEPETNFLARLRDRIVNQGMQPIFEAAARIEHLEDLVFERGTRGIREAIAIIKHAADNTSKSVTAKIDGKPAIIWGRKPSGEFVLTDKAGFNAKKYDGLATSPEQIEKIMTDRGPGRGELIAIYAKLFPLLEASLPANFNGYVKGDLLYVNQPPEIAGAFVFKPNFIEYKIPAASKLGQKIAQSEVAVAVHTVIRNDQEQPIGKRKLDSVPGLLLVYPSDFSVSKFAVDQQILEQIQDLLASHSTAIDHLFNPANLRANKITDLPQLCKRFINSRITTNFDNLLPGFLEWLPTNTTPSKAGRIQELVESAPKIQEGISAAFAAFLLLHDLKMSSLTQLDRAQPGHEGWVASGPHGQAKLVNRFDFSAGNRQLNNPTR